jgi:signal transduction histidine kinase
MDQIQTKRVRLLRQTARALAGAALLASLAVLTTPPIGGQLAYWIAVPLYAIAAVFAWNLVTPRSTIWTLGILGVAILIVVVLALGTPGFSLTRGFALILLFGGAVPGALVSLLAARRGILWFWLCTGLCAATVGLVGAVSLKLLAVTVVLLGSAICFVVGSLLSSSIAPAVRQVAEVGRAHRAERHASELEAQRRQSARLLHDTVLATLTLLAHSGRGVSEDALREQARNDAHLLRLLRLGEPLFTLPGAGYRPEPVEETTLGTTLDSVKQRFDLLGLDVTWHGSGRLLLPPGVLDAFLFAISECLENVRRHSGVELAHVTITEDDLAIRAMITDAGRGFEIDGIAQERLGLKESVIARLAEAGGSARLFSSPGAGTTVLLEVPR